MTPRLVTLTTDVGPAYAAQMKATLLREAPGAALIDLALDLRPHAIDEAAFLWDHMARGFPPGTVHLGVVDPGVGGRRDALAVGLRDGSWLVAPDNGLADRLAARVGVRIARSLAAPRLKRRPRVGATFDGRDLFAPAAAALVRGDRPGSLGPRRAFRPIPPAPAERRDRGARGRIVHVDRFGNAISDVPSTWAPTGGRVEFRVGGARWRPAARVRVYEELAPRTVGLLASSFGTLELARARRPFVPPDGRAVGARLHLRWAEAVPAARDGK